MVPVQFWDVCSIGELQPKKKQKLNNDHFDLKNIYPVKNYKSDASAKKCRYQKLAKVGYVQ